MKVYKLKFAKRFENLLDVRLRKIEVKRSNVKPFLGVSLMTLEKSTTLTACRRGARSHQEAGSDS